MKVLFLVTDDWYFLSHRLDLACAVRDEGAEVVVVTGPGERSDELLREGFRHRVVPFARSVKGQAANALLVSRLARVYREEAPDLVHHVSFLPIFYGTLAARLAGVPCVVNAVTGLGHAFSTHRRGSLLLRWLLGLGYRSALRRRDSLTLFQNGDDRSQFVRAGLVRDEDCVDVPGAGVDVEEFRPAPRPDDPVVLHASRMLYSKGVADTVEASRLARERGFEHRLVLAGRTHPTNPESIPEATLEAWREEGVAEWIGHCDDMPSLLASSTVITLPSLYREGIPLALIEAAAAGRPIVTTNVPGCRAVVQHGVNGFVVEPGAPGEVADALVRLGEDPALWASMAAASRDIAVQRFAREIVLERTFHAYDRLLGEGWREPTAVVHAERRQRPAESVVPLTRRPT